MTSHRLLLILIAPFLLTACSSTRTVRVPVPPRVDLRTYPTVGLVAFTSNANADVERLATQKFLQEVQSAQPGTKVVELGSESAVLSSVGRQSWDSATLRAVKEKHGVEALLIGRLDVERAKPQVQLSTMWKNLSARADVKAALSARLIETGSGATVWTDSAKLTTNVASGSLSERGGGFSARDPEAAYGTMVDGLVCEVTDDFRTHYVTRRVPRNDVQTASMQD